MSRPIVRQLRRIWDRMTLRPHTDAVESTLCDMEASDLAEMVRLRGGVDIEDVLVQLELKLDAIEKARRRRRRLLLLVRFLFVACGIASIVFGVRSMLHKEFFRAAVWLLGAHVFVLPANLPIRAKRNAGGASVTKEAAR